MVQQVIDVGLAPNDGNGDPLRTAGIKMNQNFDELFAGVEDIVYVRTSANFPTPSGGISDLGAKFYLLVTTTPIDVSFRLRQTDSRGVIRGLGNVSTRLNFTNTSAVDANIINTAGVGITIENTVISSPNAPLFDCDGNNTALFSLDNVVLTDMADIGQIDSFVATIIDSPLLSSTVTGGLSILGNSFNVTLMDIGSQANNAIAAFDMTDAGLSIQNLSISDCTAPLLTTTNKFCDIDPTKVVTGTVVNSTFTGTEPLGSAIDNTTPNFDILGGSGVENTRKIGSVSLTPIFTAVTSVMGTKVEIEGTWTAAASNSQFSLLTNGIQFDGLPSDVFEVTAVITGDRVGGTGSDTYEGVLLIDDVEVSDSISQSSMSDKGGTIQLSTFTTLANLEHITTSISNETGTSSIDITSAKINVRRAS